MSKKIDEDELKKTFAMFDSGDGVIEQKDLISAMRALGVKVSANAMAKVLKNMDSNGDGMIQWSEFFDFFSKVSDPEEIKNLYDAEGARYFDYKKRVDEDPNFAKTFLLPPVSVNSTKSFEGHNDTVEVVCWLSDNIFASAATDGEIILWDASEARKRPRPVRSMSESDKKNPIYCMAADQDGKRLVTGMGTNEENLWLWDAIDKERDGCLQKFDGMGAPIYSVAFSRDDRHVLSGGKKGKVCLHDLDGEVAPKTEWQAHDRVVYSLRFGPGESPQTLASASADGKVKVFDLRAVASGAKVVIEDAAVEGAVYKVLWRGANELLSCGDDYCIKRWDVRSTKFGPVASYLGHSSVVKAIALSPDERFLVSSTVDGSVRIWLADELGLIESRKSAVALQLQALRKKHEKLVEKMSSGGDVDPADLRSIDTEQEEYIQLSELIEQVRRERQEMSCIQACAGLQGHSQSVVSIAWRDRPDFGACVLTSSTDQTIRLYPVDVNKLSTVSLWSDATRKKQFVL